jgi:hypothetical protein
MRKGRVLPELRECTAGHAQRVERSTYDVPEVELRHPFGERCERRLEGLDGDVIGALHQSDFGRRFDHPAAGGDGSGQHEAACRRCSPEAFGDEEPDALLDADCARRGAAIPEDAGDHGAPVLLLLPHSHIVAEPGDLPRPRLFEGRRDVCEVTPGRDDQQERALAGAPGHVDEVAQARARFEHDGSEAVLAHEPTRLVDACVPLVIADRHGRTGKRLQGGYRRWACGALPIVLSAT